MTTNIHFYCILFCNNCQYTTAAFCEICETLLPSRQPWYNKSSIRVPDGTQAERNGIDYEQITSLLVAGWQEHEKTITELKTEISDLKEEINDLKNIIDELKTMVRGDE